MNTIHPALAGLNGITTEMNDAKTDPKTLELKEKCQEFEAVLTSLVLKEGLKAARNMSKDEEGDGDQGAESFREIAHEQMAYFVGKQGMVGLGDTLFNQLATRMEGIKSNEH